MDHISISMEEGLAPDDVWIRIIMLLGYALTLTLRAKLIQPPWVVSIRENLLKAEKAETPDAWAKVCIYRVPKALRDVNTHAFDPQIVSIGPYHHGKQGLRDMDIHKWRCLRKIIGRCKLDEVFLFNSIREVVSKARKCYEGTIELSDDEFVETMVLDGCFLLEIFRGCLHDSFKSLGYSPDDPVFSLFRALGLIRQDVKRLENQVPLFILERLLGLITNEMKDKKVRVVRLALNYFRLTPFLHPLPRHLPVKYRKCVHCLDIYRQFLLDDESTPFPKTPIPQQTSKKFKKLLHLITPACYRKTSNLDPPNSPPTEQLTVPCVTKLRKAGVEFKKLLHLITPACYRNTSNLDPPNNTIPCVTKLREAGIKFQKEETKCFFDIKFEAGVLRIPVLHLDDNSRREFPNLIAFEQCHLGCSDVTSYAKFMDDLIDSSDDIAYLHDRGIIDPFGGGSYKETADFFNSIVNEAFFHPPDSYLWGVTRDLSEKVQKYHESKTRNWTVKIKRMYFSYPWSTVSLFAGIFLVVLTFLATFYAMYGYYKPRS